MATKTPKTQFDSMWDEKKDAEAAANRFRRFWMSASVKPRKSAPGWEVHISDNSASSAKKSVRAAAKQKFPDARSLTVTFRHGYVYLQVNTKKVYRVIRSKASVTGFNFVEQ
jgi:hypothetical protein